MTVKILFSNIKSLSYHHPNKTVKNAADHFGIKIVALNNYENGKMPLLCMLDIEQ